VKNSGSTITTLVKRILVDDIFFEICKLIIEFSFRLEVRPSSCQSEIGASASLYRVKKDSNSLQIFAKMKEKDLEFWGLCRHHPNSSKMEYDHHG